jgi:WhiB family redox-sensing transcriptional regulator
MTMPFPLADIDERPWASYAACRDADPDLFFGGEDAQTREAVKICRGCAVRDACLEWALEMRITYGIWGGLTERERRRALRRTA